MHLLPFYFNLSVFPCHIMNSIFLCHRKPSRMSFTVTARRSGPASEELPAALPSSAAWPSAAGDCLHLLQLPADLCRTPCTRVVTPASPASAPAWATGDTAPLGWGWAAGTAGGYAEQHGPRRLQKLGSKSFLVAVKSVMKQDIKCFCSFWDIGPLHCRLHSCYF